MKYFLIACIYCFGSIISYVMARNNGIKNKQEWTIADRTVYLLLSCLSWIFFILILIFTTKIDWKKKSNW